jgi:hypothetical protein
VLERLAIPSQGEQRGILYANRTHEGPCWKDIPFQFQTDTDTALDYRKAKVEDFRSDLQRNHQEMALFGVQ